MNVPLPDPPSKGLLRCPILSGVVLLRRRRPILTPFFSLHPPWGKHASLAPCSRCGRGSTAASSPFGVFDTFPHRVALFWLGLVVVFVLLPGRNGPQHDLRFVMVCTQQLEQVTVDLVICELIGQVVRRACRFLLRQLTFSVRLTQTIDVDNTNPMRY